MLSAPIPAAYIRFGMNIGIKKIHRHVSNGNQAVQDGRTAGAAAGMKQDARLDALLLPTLAIR